MESDWGCDGFDGFEVASVGWIVGFISRNDFMQCRLLKSSVYDIFIIFCSVYCIIFSAFGNLFVSLRSCVCFFSIVFFGVLLLVFLWAQQCLLL